MSDLKDDITYMRRLAERGRQGPILGGAFLAGAGVIYGVTCFVHGGIQQGILPSFPNATLKLWIGASLVFAVLWLALFARLRTKPGLTASATSSAFGMAWTGSAVGISVCCIAIAIISAITHAPAVMALYAPIAFAFYGVVWCTVGAMMHRPWMYAAAVAAFLATLFLAVLTGNPWQLPVMGLALLLTLSVPGFLLMFEESR